MSFTAEGDDGTPVDFECAHAIALRARCDAILTGKSYPALPFVGDVRVVFDVRADCGAATVYFARHYPDAQVHSFEPASERRAVLERNAAGYPNVHVHAVGPSSVDRVVPLGIARIDVLRVDALGAVDALESLADLLPTVKVLYVEYDSRQSRREIARLMSATHDLYVGVVFLDRGECVYLGRELVDLDAATLHLRRAFAAGRSAQAK